MYLNPNLGESDAFIALVRSSGVRRPAFGLPAFGLPALSGKKKFPSTKNSCRKKLRFLDSQASLTQISSRHSRIQSTN